MRYDATNRNVLTAVILMLMFLFADVFVPSAFPAPEYLEEEPSVQHVITNVNPAVDTYIDSANPSTSYSTDATGLLGVFGNSEGRILISFQNNFGSSDRIHSAQLQMVCSAGTASSSLGIYPASTKTTWDENATWVTRNGLTAWGSNGAEGSSDRTDWEPPTETPPFGQTGGSNTFQLNVTSLVQEGVATGASHFDLVISAHGSQHNCTMSEGPNAPDHPTLIVDSTPSSTVGSGGLISPNFIDDGMPLMTGDFFLAADLTPSMTWDGYSGVMAEVQLSLDEDFKDVQDNYDWLYNSYDQSPNFAFSGTTGSLNIPQSDAFNNGTEMHYRMRAMDSTGRLGSWTNGYFFLPSHDVILNDNGTASLIVDHDDLDADFDFIVDTYVDEDNKNTNYGSSATMKTQVTSSRESISHVRLNFDHLGLHSNATILDASLNLTRLSFSGTPTLALHQMNTVNLWDETGVTWRRPDSGQIWNDGGRDYIGIATDSFIDGAKGEDEFAFDVTSFLQQHLDSNSTGSIDFAITARSENGAYTTGGVDSIDFHTSEASSFANKPKLFITYDWSPAVSVSPVLTSPSPEETLWNKSGHNFTGNQTPTIAWQSSTSSSYNMILELSTESSFHDRVVRIDTRNDNDFVASDGEFTFTGDQSLDTGHMYHWRMLHVDVNGRHGEWSYSSFLISAISSTWLGGDRYEFRLKQGNASSDGLYPQCSDAYIDSGFSNSNYGSGSELQVSYNTYSTPTETTILFGCDLSTTFLPTGYAVESAQLEMYLQESPTGIPIVGAWENMRNNWTQDGATWSTYDGVNSWSTSGAKGSDRGSLLDTTTIGSGFTSASSATWNVTLAVQNAMRDNHSADFILGIIGAGSGQTRDVLLHSGSGIDAKRPELSFVYVPGSNAIPNEPVPVSPLNGSWSIKDGINPEPIYRPTMNWTDSSAVTVDGYAVQMDTVDTFNSGDMSIVTSWSNTGFDLLNKSYTPTSDLTDGKTWYWRVRSISSTNQLGNWSNSFHFQLPSLTTWNLSSTKAAVEIRHNDALPHLQLPHFIDTWLADGGFEGQQNHSSSSSLKVGKLSSGHNASALLNIPLNQIPNPSNARVVDAQLSLLPQFGSGSNVNVAVRPVLQPWTTQVNNSSYDGTNSWAADGGRAIGSDVGQLSDIAVSSTGAWMEWDVTELVQAAIANGDSYLSIALMTSDSSTGLITFTSTEGAISDRPWLNLTWSDGLASIPSSAASNALPTDGSIAWNSTGHVPEPLTRPIISWTHGNSANIDAWRIFIQNDEADLMEGFTMYDSRQDSSLFDVQNQTFQPPNDLSTNQSIRWFVQPINNSMLGPRSTSSVFHIPNDIGNEINSTWGYINVSEGGFLPDLNEPSGFVTDSTLDSVVPNSNLYNSGTISVGRSSYNTGTSQRSSFIVSVDLTKLPINGTYEIMDAFFTLNTKSSSYGKVWWSSSSINTAFDGDANWNNATSSTQWNSPGAYHSSDTDIPFGASLINSSDASHRGELTVLLQRAVASGATTLDFLVQAEEDSGSVDGRIDFYSSNEASTALRPSLNITYRMTNAYVDSSPTGLLPVDATTVWNYSSPRPSGADHVNLSWTPPSTNESGFYICSASDARMIYDLNCESVVGSNPYTKENITWDPANSTITVANITAADNWIYWRVLSYQEIVQEKYFRFGEWSQVNTFRVPDDQGYDDGAGNHTVNLSSGSIFSETGLLPAAPDVHTVSSTSNTNYGGSATLKLGTGSSGDHEIFIEFDVSQMPWPNAMTPTSTILRLYRTQVSGVTPLTVSAHACSSIGENTVTANQPPTCNLAEITRSTLSVSPATGWLEWDITSLAQSNIANGNKTFSIKLAVVGSATTLHTFASGEATNAAWRPTLVIDYVDNVDGIVPPGQPTLLSPADGDILYDTSADLLDSVDKPTLTWNAVTDATGYVVTIRNATGQYTFKSATSSQITGTSFTFANNVAPGSTFEWWVQAVNGSIPGPSSSRWIVGVGDPQTSDNNDHTWTYNFQTGNEIQELSHTNVQDVSIFSGLASTNLDGNANVIGIDASQDEYRLLLSADFGQIPFNPSMNVHSVSLGMYLEDLNSGAGATGMNFTVHRVITIGWSETSATWDGTGTASWAASGMQAGVDYDATPIDSVYMSASQATDTTIWFNLGHRMMYIDGVHSWVIIGTPVQGWMEADFADNSDTTLSNRPLLMMNYTDVDSITILPSATTTDADTAVQFSASTYDYNSLLAGAPVTWSASNGTIDSSGLFTPSFIGTHTITACFGLVCEDETVTVEPGTPVELIVTPLTATITADETLQLSAIVVDQFGNVVPGESITYTPSNGSMGGTFGDVFQPYAAGNQNVTVSWDSTSIVVEVLVELGAPTDIVLTGCVGLIPAGTECEITTTLYDQFGNTIPLTQAGTLSYSVNDGVYTESSNMYFADTVGSWQLSVTSTIGLSDSIAIETGHGEMASLEIVPSSWDITADEVVYLNTTRIDIQGNRLPVDLPLANWTSVDDGEINVTSNQPSYWTPIGLGGRVLVAQYETISESITINVTKGVMVEMVLLVEAQEAAGETFAMTADDTFSVKAKASDAKGNRWTIDVNWTIAHPDWYDQNVLSVPLSDETEFRPIKASTTAYVIRAEYTSNGQLFSEIVSVEVSVGTIQFFTMDSVASNGDTGTNLEITADESITFDPSLSDGDLNEIGNGVLTWQFEDIDSGEIVNLTAELVANGYQWEATTVGTYRISAFVENTNGFNYTRSVEISVEHGVAVSIDHLLDTFDENAGESIDITITGTDSDGNSFPQDVEWLEDDSESDRIIKNMTGVYTYQASEAGDHLMEYSVPGVSGVANSFQIKISPEMIVEYIEVELSSTTVEQQGSIEVTVQAFDRFGNPIPVPSSARIDATGRCVVESTGQGVWTVTTVESGPQTLTVSAGKVNEAFEIEVTGTFSGFFAAGGTLYYIGGVLAALVVVVVLALLLMAIRSARDDDWDDDDYDYEEEDEPKTTRGPTGPAPGPTGPAPGPTGPAPGPTGPAPVTVESEPAQDEEEEEDTSWMVDYRVDDDGTEWAQGEDETWYYRESGQSDWSEWQG